MRVHSLLPLAAAFSPKLPSSWFGPGDKFVRLVRARTGDACRYGPSKYGGIEVSEAKGLRQLEEENRQVKHIVAEQAVGYPSGGSRHAPGWLAGKVAILLASIAVTTLVTCPLAGSACYCPKWAADRNFVSDGGAP